MKLKNLEDVLHHQLKDLRSAEDQLTKALPKMAKAAQSEELRKAFEMHLEQTKAQLERLEKLSDTLNMKITGEKCQAMEGLIKEGESLIQENDPSEALDAALIAASQRIEHYEMSAYGSACAFAKQLGHTEAQKLLQQTLDEEYAANEKLNTLALNSVNQKAMKS